MTVLDLIRRFKAKGKDIHAFDLFITNGFDIEESIYYSEESKDGFNIPYYDCEIPPECITLDDHPDYLLIESKEDYLSRKLTDKRIPTVYPRLMILIQRDASYNLATTWKGHMWHEIPSMELRYVPAEGGMTPELDKEGRFTHVRDDVGFLTGVGKPAYYVKDDRGFIWEWTGDPFKDKLPDGLHFFDAKKEFGEDF